MEGGRFGPVKPDRSPKKQYKVDTNRLITFVMVIAIIVLCVFIYMDWKRGKDEQGVEIVTASMPPSAFAPRTSVQPTMSVESLRPRAEEGKLPVFRFADTAEKRVAITLDSIGSAANIESLLALCKEYGARVTFFPTGIELNATAGLWGQVVLGGHQIENHTYQNADLANMTYEQIADELGAQVRLVRAYTTEAYAPHFVRPGDLLNLDIETLYSYLIAEGYFGIASWAVDTPASFDEVAPGQIIRYKLDDAGLKRLKQAIPYLAQNGYQMVTLNALFMYPDNLDSSEAEG